MSKTCPRCHSVTTEQQHIRCAIGSTAGAISGALSAAGGARVDSRGTGIGIVAIRRFCRRPPRKVCSGPGTRSSRLARSF